MGCCKRYECGFNYAKSSLFTFRFVRTRREIYACSSCPFGPSDVRGFQSHGYSDCFMLHGRINVSRNAMVGLHRAFILTISPDEFGMRPLVNV